MSTFTNFVFILDTRGNFNYRELTLIPAWIGNYIFYKVWDEITYSFPNFNGATVEVWEWISNFIPLMGMWLFIHAGLNVLYVSNRGHCLLDRHGFMPFMSPNIRNK